ncbi:MAG: AraC family transcriptional regulator [Chitinophagaceae bacterium]
MNFSISRNGEALHFTDQLPPDLLLHKVFLINFITEGPWGILHFQVLAAKEFSIWYSIYTIREQSSFHIKADIESTGLHFTLKNKLHFDTADLGTIKTRTRQFNLTYMPAVDTTGHFAPGKYKSFDISYHNGYLSRYVAYLKKLEQFTLNIEKKIATRLHPAYLTATPEMIAVINSILQHDYSHALSTMYIDCKAQELLILSVEKMSNEANKKFNLNREDEKLFENIHIWLTDNIDFTGSLTDLAQQFQTNDFKLKRGFKELYGSTVFEMLFLLRMERARKMLLETKLPVTEIGYRAGYSSGPNFSDAFKKHFGHPPNFLRKR